MLGLIVASLNALLWIAMIVIAFVQVGDPPPLPNGGDLSMQSLYMFFCAGLQSDWCRTRAEEECGEQKVASLPIHCLSAVGFGQLCLVHSSCEAQGRWLMFFIRVVFTFHIYNYTSLSIAGQAVWCAGRSLGHACSCYCSLFCADHSNADGHLQPISQRIKNPCLYANLCIHITQ